jgi:hypothetical protein
VHRPSLRGAEATKQSSLSGYFWIASRSLSSGAHTRDPLARNEVVTFPAQYHGCAGEFNDVGGNGFSIDE